MARLYGGGFYNRAVDFEQAWAIASENDDYDQPWQHGATPWEIVGDWEGGDMASVPPSVGSSQSSWINASSAALAEMNEGDEDRADETGLENQQLNLAALDLLFSQNRD